MPASDAPSSDNSLADPSEPHDKGGTAQQAAMIAAENAALRRGYLEDFARAEATFSRMADEVDTARREAVRATNEMRLAKWKLQSFRRRRWWRIGGALSGARKGWPGLVRVPSDLWGAVFDRVPPLPRPQAKKYRGRPTILRGDDGWSLPEPRVPNERTVRGLVDEGHYDEAVLLVDELLAERPNDGGLLREKRHAHLRRGDLEEAFDATAALRLLSDTSSHRQAERNLWGRLRELSPLYGPEVPGEPEVLEPKSKSVVMHLLKESAPYFERGYTMRSQAMLQAQRQAGYEPFVVTSLGFPRRDGFEEFDPIEMVDGIEMVRLDAGPGYDVRTIPWDVYLQDYAFMAARALAHRAPALLHAGSGYRGFDSALVGIALKRRFGVPLVYDVRSFLEHTWTDDMDVAESSSHYRARYATEVRCMHEADFVLTIGNAMRDDLIARGIPETKIGVVPNVVDTSVFSPRPPDSALLEAYGLAGREAVLGYVSNLGSREGIDVLVAAIAVLREQGLDVGGLIVGDGPERSSLELLAQDLGIADAITFTGQVPHEDVVAHYSLIDVFVVPRKDDFAARLVTPLKPFEAMAMGLPVVVSALPGLLEIVQPDDRGLAFPPGDSSALANTVGRLLADSDLRERLATNGREWVEAERTVEANSRRYHAIYDAILGGRYDVGGPAS